jgi:hypothetical protein
MNARIPFVLISVAVVVLLGIAAFQEASIVPLNSSIIIGRTGSGLQVVVLKNQDASSLGIPLSRLGFNDTGSAPGREVNSAGIPIEVYDSGHLSLALYAGRFSNGTAVVVVTLKNVGAQNVTIDQLGIGGWNHDFPLAGPLQVDIIGCTHGYTYTGVVVTGYPNGTTISSISTFTVLCGTIAAFSPWSLKLGESFSAYILGNLTTGSVQMRNFSAGLSYAFDETPYGWGIQVGQFP